MPIKLMYITNNPEVAKIAENAGVERIFVDMEYIGKDKRQGGMDTVKSHHTISDVISIKKALTSAKLLVRCNPLHQAEDGIISSEDEIDAIVKSGADIVMLPYFKTAEEVKTFVNLVGGRAKTMVLLETPEAAESIEEILAVPGLDEIYIGLNDLSIGYGKKFMFELLADGTVDKLVGIIKKRGIPYGFGGLASLDGGLLPGRLVLAEHKRLGSNCVILSRSFLNTGKIKDMDTIEKTFSEGIKAIRQLEEKMESVLDFEENSLEVRKSVEKVLEKM